MTTSQTTAARTTGISRRSPTRGAAWAAPIAAVATAAPAYAASSTCSPSIGGVGGAGYDWGYTDGSVRTTSQTLTFGGQVIVASLPPDVNVLEVEQHYYFANRIGQTSQGPNALWINNSASACTDGAHRPPRGPAVHSTSTTATTTSSTTPSTSATCCTPTA